MTRGLVLAANGVSDTHLEYAYHRLREDAVIVDVATPDGEPARTDVGRRRDALAVADLPPTRRYDLVVIPGGDSPDQLADHAETRRRLVEHLDGGGVVCAVAEGVRLLMTIDILDGRLVTGPAGLEDDLVAAGARYTGEAVTVDGPIVMVGETDALPFGIAAALGNVVIPQGPADEATERPHWTVSNSSGE